MSRLNPSIHVNLTESVISKLFNKGIYTGFDFINKATDLLIKNTGLSFKEIIEIKNVISKSSGGIEIINGLEFTNNKTIISTELFSLDKLLDGGLFSKQIYEFCGASSSGKTQLCLTIATRIVLKTNQVVHFIDTKGDFPVLRVEQMLRAQNCSVEDIVRVLKNIKVTEVTSANGLFSVLHYLGNISRDEFSAKLLVIDSLSTFCLTSTINSESTLSLNYLREMLHFIAIECNIAIITTNLVTQWSEEGTPFTDGVKPTIFKPTLGKFWFQVPHTRLLLEQVKNEERSISVWQSSDLIIGSNCSVNINDAGVY